MPQSFRSRILLATLTSLLIASCGGGSSSSAGGGTTTPVSAPISVAVGEIGAPQATGDTATDGLNWLNFRRQQVGLQQLKLNSLVTVAAQGHSNYQKLNTVITHTQTFGNPGYTGTQLADRLMAAKYFFTSSSYAYGEVISATGDTSGANAAEDLITAIYHRFVIFEPMFKEAGGGAATSSGAYTYFTADLVADNLDKGIGAGKLVTYPFAGQQNVLTQFNSDNESPDPVPGKGIVGFPISVHADVNSMVKVQSFTLTPRCGSAQAAGCGMPLTTDKTILLSSATDSLHTPTSAAALIPIDVLAGQTTYDVRFVGTVGLSAAGGTAVDRSWSFTTR